jgi:C4-dicarboxylate-specific signal transduction histidine kinase
MADDVDITTPHDALRAIVNITQLSHRVGSMETEVAVLVQKSHRADEDRKELKAAVQAIHDFARTQFESVGEMLNDLVVKASHNEGVKQGAWKMITVAVTVTTAIVSALWALFGSHLTWH